MNSKGFCEECNDVARLAGEAGKPSQLHKSLLVLKKHLQINKTI